MIPSLIRTLSLNFDIFSGIITRLEGLRMRGLYPLTVVFSGLLFLSAPAAAQPAEPLSATSVQDGIAVKFEVRRLPEGSAAEFREGDRVRFRFSAAEASTGGNLPAGQPAGWMIRHESGPPLSGGQCTQAASRLIGGSLLSKPEIDLNAYYVLVLHQDSTISVVDPLFGFGNSQLLALIPLKSSGYDWTLAGEDRLFVSIPDANAVAAIETATWKVIREVAIGAKPDRIAAQPNGLYVWTAYADEPSGVAVISTADARLVARIRTGRGPHQFAFSADGRFVFVTNAGSRTVSVINAQNFRKIRDIAVNGRPVSIAFSALANRAYVALEDTGCVAVCEAKRARPVSEMAAEPGLRQIRVSPNGRFAFVVNPPKNLLHIIDVSTNRIVQTGNLEHEPDQITFSDNLAYIRLRKSENVLMVPLDGIGTPGEPLSVGDFPGGQHPAGQANHPSPADSFAQAPGEGAVLVANPLDKAVYYYKEGMAAPMGSFSTYGREARAILVVDRSLHRRPSGVYEADAVLPRAGSYDMVFLMDSPRLVSCFPVPVQPNPSLPSHLFAAPIIVAEIKPGQRFKAGEPIQVRFQVLDAATRAPKADLSDLRVVAFRAPGSWRYQQWARQSAPGLYQAEFAPPEPGEYHISFECLSLGLRINNPQEVELYVEAASPGGH